MQGGVERRAERGVAGDGAEGVGVAAGFVVLADVGAGQLPAAGCDEAVEGVGDVFGEVVAAPVANLGEQEFAAGGPGWAGERQLARDLVDGGPGEAGQVAGGAGARHAGGVHFVVLHAQQGELLVVGVAVGPVGRLDADVGEGAGEGVALLTQVGHRAGVGPQWLLLRVAPGGTLDEAGDDPADGAPQGDVVVLANRGAGVAAQAASRVGGEPGAVVDQHQGVAWRVGGAGFGLGPNAPGDAVLAPQAHQEGRVGFVPLDAHLPLGVAVGGELAGVEVEAAGQHRAVRAPFAEELLGDLDDVLAEVDAAVAAGAHEGAGIDGFDEPGLQAAVELPRLGAHDEGVEGTQAAAVGDHLELQGLAQELPGCDVGPGGDAQEAQAEAGGRAGGLAGVEAVDHQRVGEGGVGAADAQPQRAVGLGEAEVLKPGMKQPARARGRGGRHLAFLCWFEGVGAWALPLACREMTLK
jgi:hypothetical protein